jgi:hypothetical protein
MQKSDHSVALARPIIAHARRYAGMRAAATKEVIEGEEDAESDVSSESTIHL